MFRRGFHTRTRPHGAISPDQEAVARPARRRGIDGRTPGRLRNAARLCRCCYKRKVQLVKNIDQNLPRWRSFEGHRAPVPVFVDDQNVAEITGCNLVAVDLSSCRIREWFTEPHRHATDEVYVCVDSENVIAAEVEIDGITTAVRSPFVVRIPAGRLHRFRPLHVPKRPAYILGLFPVNHQQSAKGTTKNENDHVTH